MTIATALDRRVWTDIIEANSKATTMLGTVTPLWAIAVSIGMSGPMPGIGVTPIAWSVFWVFLTALGAAGRLLTDHRFRHAKKNPARLNVRFWLAAFAASSSFVTVTWAVGFWIHFEEGNTANLLFLMALMMASVTQATVQRTNHFAGSCALILPAVIIPTARLILVDDPVAVFCVILFPLWVGVVLFHVRRASLDVVRTYRMRYELEAMAADLEAARDEAIIQRAHADRSNASKSAFLANMSHELRTPLNAILGFSEIIATDALGERISPKYQVYAGDILSSGRHLLSLINGLLDIAKIEAGRLELSPEWLDADETASECLRFVETEARRGDVRVSYVAPKDLELYADEQAFRQVLINLLSNAVKFTPPGGSVDVTVEAESGHRTLVVRDSGCGIPVEEIQRLFRPFEQLENNYGKSRGGTGLGLALVKALAELHGGSCDLSSQVGAGTEVRVRFPVPKQGEALPAPLKLSA